MACEFCPWSQAADRIDDPALDLGRRTLPIDPALALAPRRMDCDTYSSRRFDPRFEHTRRHRLPRIVEQLPTQPTRSSISFANARFDDIGKIPSHVRGSSDAADLELNLDRAIDHWNSTCFSGLDHEIVEFAGMESLRLPRCVGHCWSKFSTLILSRREGTAHHSFVVINRQHHAIALRRVERAVSKIDEKAPAPPDER